MTTWGATGNQFGCIWLYEPATCRFEYNKNLADPEWGNPNEKAVHDYILKYS